MSIIIRDVLGGSVYTTGGGGCAGVEGSASDSDEIHGV